MKANIPAGTVLFVLLLSAALYLWTADVYTKPYGIDDVGMFGQMILSVSKVDLIEADQYNLPWSGKTWLITLVVNPQEAESILASKGYLEDTIPNEAIASDNQQARYDVKIRITPVTQQCIYGPDFTTLKREVPVRAHYFEKDLGSGSGCPYLHTWESEVVRPEATRLMNAYNYSTVAYDCQYYCKNNHAYVVCVFVGFKESDRIGVAKLTLKSLYVKDRISVQAGYKTASGETEDAIETGSSNPSAILRYGSQAIGKVDLVGYLKASAYCPEGANYFVFNNGKGWKVVPETTYEDLDFMVKQLITRSISIPECAGLSGSSPYEDFVRCKEGFKKWIDQFNSLLDVINNTTPIIEGKIATKPSASEYSAAYYFAIQPDDPVVYSMYRMYLKADWVGILISAARPVIEDVTPTSITLSGPESKTLTVTVRNIGDEGGIIVKVSCSKDFLVDGKQESMRSVTLKPNDAQSFQFSISYGGSGTTAAGATCVVTAVSSANPSVKSTKYVNVRFTPKGEYPPNTTVCISRTTYARTDQYGNIIPGTEQSCGEGKYCEQTDKGAVCKEEEIKPPENVEKEKEVGPGILILAIAAIAMFMAILIALVV